MYLGRWCSVVRKRKGRISGEQRKSIINVTIEFLVDLWWASERERENGGGKLHNFTFFPHPKNYKEKTG